MTTVAIAVNGIDITSSVIFSDARFISKANGAAGTCEFRVRDLDHVFHTLTIGDEITLDLDGVRAWGGYIIQLNRGYFFDARDCSCPQTTPIYYRVVGSDYNILLHKRFIFDLSNPTNFDLTTFPPGTADRDVILAYTANHLDLTGDDLEIDSLVEHVGTPSIDEDISFGTALSWNELMSSLSWNTGSIWYIDPDKSFVYTDVDTPDAPFGISDQPTTGEVGCREMEIEFDGTRLINDALVWGTGVGSPVPVVGRIQDAASIAEHGRWQIGRIAGRAWLQETVDRTANVYVYGSPQSQRGGKDDRRSVNCTIYVPGLRVADKVNFRSAVFGFEQVIPVRTITMTFPTPDAVRYDIRLSHEIDEPIDLIDPPPPYVAPPPQICTSQFFIAPEAPDNSTSLVGTTAAPTSLAPPSSNDFTIGGHLGRNDWYVTILPVHSNAWQWTGDPDYMDTLVPGGPLMFHSVHKQYTDLYHYGIGGSYLISEGERTEAFMSQFQWIRVPSDATKRQVGIADVTISITQASALERIVVYGADIFPFFGPINGVDISAERFGLAWGTFPAVQLNAVDRVGIPYPWGTSGEPTDWTWSKLIALTDDDRLSARIVTAQSLDDGSITYRRPLGTWDPGTYLIGWVQIWDFDRVIKDLNVAGVTVSAEIKVLWKDEEEEALGLKSLAGEAPICINIGRNCQMAKKIGSHGYQVLGSFALGSTEVSVNGVRRQLGVDYTESDPAHGMIEFSDALDIDAQVWVCYSASSFANPWDEGLTATAGVFDFPTIGAITGTFGDQSSGWGEAIWHGSYYSHFHNGVDFGVPVGTPVRAAADGMVSWEDQFAGGSMIHIYHGPPAVPISCRTTYAHLSSRIVAPGEFVTQGQIIGTSGDSGQVTGPHLHWGMVVAGSAEDPLPWTTLPGFPL